MTGYINGYPSTNPEVIFQTAILAESTSGYIRALKYWPRVLSNAEMQAVTTLAGPTLSLDFMQPGTLDPRIVFSRASSATYTDASGVIQTAATNAPRWDYDPVTHALRGVLIEEQRTNIAVQSADFTAGAWIKSGVTVAAPVVTANVVNAPDGTLTADRIVYPAVSVVGTASEVYQPFTAAGATPYTYSVWLRGNAGGEVVSLFGGSVEWIIATFTLTTAWQRFTVTTPTLTAGTGYFNIGTDERGTAMPSSPAQTIYAWGADIQQGAFVTSHIPTTSAAATRAADIAVMPTDVSWFSPNFGSLLAEFLSFNPGVADHRGIVRMDDTTDTNFSQMFLAPGPNAYFYSRVAGADIFLTNTGVLATGTVGKIATCYGGASWRGAYKGVIYTSPSTALPLPANRMMFGADNVDTTIYKLNGYIRRVTYWNRALSDTEMQQVTT